jgi:hypothetical protein
MDPTTMTNARLLPPAYADLEPFTAAWMLPDEKTRYDKLLATDMPELRAFYDAMLPRMEEIILYLNQFPLDAMPEDSRHLFDLAMTFMETAHPVDLRWKTTDIDDKFPADRFEFSPPSCA